MIYIDKYIKGEYCINIRTICIMSSVKEVD